MSQNRIEKNRLKHTSAHFWKTQIKHSLRPIIHILVVLGGLCSLPMLAHAYFGGPVYSNVTDGSQNINQLATRICRFEQDEEYQYIVAVYGKATADGGYLSISKHGEMPDGRTASG